MVRKTDIASSFSTLSVSFDTLLELQQDFRQLFAWVQKNRYESVTVMLGGYSHIKTAKKLLDALVNYRYTPSKLATALMTGIQKLNLLFHHLSTESRNDDPSDRPLRKMLSALLDKLGSLLPQDAGVQLLLFGEDEYQQEGWVKTHFPRFSAMGVYPALPRERVS
ncbi:MAG: hypothetical protein HC930_01515 [Hydrococcus sp. SU_1_0]|nr:hypothetical protein [Hydrococcus sp. SU_1_0]